MNRKFKFGALAAGLLVGTSSLALGTTTAAATETTAPASTFGWTAFHLGVTGGYGAAVHNAGFQLYEYMELPWEYLTPDQDLYSLGAALDFGGRGPLAAIDGGFDMQLGSHFVVGILGDYTLSRIRTEADLFGEVCYELATPDDCDTATISDSPEASLVLLTGNSWTIGVRAGFLATPRALFYGLVGYTRTAVTLTGSLTSDPATGTVEIAHGVIGGPTFGFGVEALLSPSLSARLEYRISPLGVGHEDGGDTFGYRVWDHATVQTIRGTISYRFPSGWGPRLTDTPPMDAASVNWTGLHLGAEAGYGVASHTFGFEVHDYDLGGLAQAGGFPGTIEGFDLFSVGANIDLGGKGPVESLSAGYDWQLGNRFVFGVLGDYTFGSVTATATAFGTVCFDVPSVCNTPQDPLMPNPDFRVAANLTVGNMWTVGARAGYLAGDRTLLYVLAAYSDASFDVNVNVTTPGGTTEIFDHQFTRNAFTFGAGVEAMLTAHVTAKLEYRGMIWSNTQSFGDDVFGASVHSSGYEQTIRAGLTWRFGNP